MGNHVARAGLLVIGLSTVMATAQPEMALTAPPTRTEMEVSQTLRGYLDSRGTTRRGGLTQLIHRRTIAAGVDLELRLTGGRDQVAYDAATVRDSDLLATHFADGLRQLDRWGGGAALTLPDGRDVRFGAETTTDGVVSARTASVGAGQWLRQDNWQVGIDLSRATVDRPAREQNTSDAQIIELPAQVSSDSAQLTVRQLISPTTVGIYRASVQQPSDRPLGRRLGAELRQYLPELRTAVHAQAYRALDQGLLSNATPDGQLEAWEAEVGVTRALSSGAQTAVTYRYYVEDEVTRGYGDERTFGSDTLTWSAHQMASDTLGLRFAVARYATNGGVVAGLAEVGVYGRF